MLSTIPAVRRARFVARLSGLALATVFLWACGQSAGSAPSSTLVPGPTVSPASSGITATSTPTDVALPTEDEASGPPSTFSPPKPGFVPGPGQSAIPISSYAPKPLPHNTTVTIVAAGDIACDPAHNVSQPHDCDQAATANLIGQLAPAAVLTLGDNQYEDNTLAAYMSVFDPTWGAYKSIIYPTIGNHEYLTPGAAGYFDYFGFPPYYSYNLGDWHIISLDSECQYVGGCSAGSAQEKWLKADLAAYPRLCTMVTWHEPRWSSGEHEDATQMTTIWSDLVAANVDVVLTGHNHDYERFMPLNASGNPDPAGTAEFVVGTGGKNHYGFAVPPLAGELVRNDSSFGVIQMSLKPTGYSWKFVPAPGYTFTDSGSATCH
jgi:acid phosphatase type 7